MIDTLEFNVFEQKLVDWVRTLPEYHDTGVSHFEFALNLLTEKCPLTQTVTIERRPLLWYGHIHCAIEGATIAIRDIADEWEAIETLMHEWAHAMNRNDDPDATLTHGPAWGVAFARCYQLVIGEITE